MRKGLVVGKFSPLHKGHEFLIEESLKRCDHLTIISYSNPEFAGCHALARQEWITKLFPGVDCHVLDPNFFPWREMPKNDASDIEQQEYLAWVLAVLSCKPDVIFCSEPWGKPCAETLSRLLGYPVEAEIIDIERARVPISATMIRSDPDRYRNYMSDVVAASFIKKIVFLGGESSGKTTLARILAGVFNTNWVHEYGRQLHEEKGGVLDEKDLVEIGWAQVAMEKKAALTSNRYLFCDTSPLTTLGYSEWMFGKKLPQLVLLSAITHYDAVILCAPDIPFEDDGSRRDAAFRAEQDAWYRDKLKEFKGPVFEAKGSLVERIDKVTEWIIDTL
jgi:NadR type nicotinamide-nucleotide adenylyltransferase